LGNCRQGWPKVAAYSQAFDVPPFSVSVALEFGGVGSTYD
jgi:hypothetical protein